ncbi:MAG: glycerate kinase [Armatimonadota bacterium]|nr:glycerate kinase [Armatimonadota bacterium]MDR7471490.1 glycerate kinase [Armatimonadota bacterium]MDR7509923.1 glycerate kinase [Armatimonadota bacterium]MDR7516394.1 glycerate kinase [Armatimonadota bacterium]MDR7560074.1 glycerate kinase [Armatimonadota bacterium]
MFDPAAVAGKPAATLRRAAVSILGAAIRAVDPEVAVSRTVTRRGPILRVGRRRYDLRRVRHVFVVGAGKACAPMAAACERVLGDRLTAGLVVVKYGYGMPLRRVEVIEAGHPLPDQAGARGAGRILDLVSGAEEPDLVLCLISGGGSALLPAPADGITLEEKMAVTDLLLRSGATIREINAVRKHLSRIKGGRLARAAAPARVVGVVLSDVPGDPLDAIASGPITPDPTTFHDALAVLQRYGLLDRVPPSVRLHLERGAAGQEPDTPKPGDPLFARVQVEVVGNIDRAVDAAAARAARLGFRPLVLTTRLEGEAREAARVVCSIVRTVRERSRPIRPPACLLAGGETTVTVRGAGRGGRCQEFALAAALAIEGWDGVVVAACGTDGTDGPTDAAGAVADGATAARARAAGREPARALADNDAYHVFQALGDLLVSGPTRTNVTDLYVALVRGKREEGKGNRGNQRRSTLSHTG